MAEFSGFTSSETFTQIPDAFFHLLKEIEDLAELKVTLHVLWQIEHTEGNFRALCEKDFEDESLGLDIKDIQRGLKKAIERGTLLKAAHAASLAKHPERAKREAQVFYFLNSPRGRLAAEAFAKGDWRGSAQVTSAPRQRSNVFKLYEENIGPLTPLIADTLKDAEGTYSQEWLADAIALSAKNNKRNWKYIEAILKRWKEEGRAEKQDRRNNQKDGQPGLNRKIEQLRKRAGK